MANKGYDMPHSLEAEKSLLGCLMLDPRIQVEIAPFLTKEDFYEQKNQTVFSAMLELINANKAVDLVTLLDVLEKDGLLNDAGGLEYITELTDIMPSSANYKEYLDIVKRDGTLRRLIDGSTKIIKKCCEKEDKTETLDYAEQMVFSISEEADTGKIAKISEVIPTVITKFDDLAKNKNGAKGISTGYRDIDRILNGLHPSDLIILAARPSVGKTSFAMNIAENVALNGYSVAVLSLEMSKEQLVQRMLCSVAQVNMSNALRGNMNKKEWVNIAKARELLSNAKIFIDESSLVTPSEILSKCRRIKRKYGLDLVVIDYIQLMSSPSNKKSDNRQQEISEISRNLKIMAKDVNVPVLALSQLSRAVETRRGRPQLSDLRESGAIEQDADIVAFIHRPDKGATEQEIKNNDIKRNVAEILIEKHRNGPTGEVKLYFEEEYTKFKTINIETGEAEDKEKDNKVADSVSGYEDLPTNINDVPFDVKEENEKNGSNENNSDDPLY